MESTTTWNPARLNALRSIMDPDADAAIEEVYKSQKGDQLRTALSQLAKNDSYSTSEYFASSDTPVKMSSLMDNELSREFSEYDLNMFRRTHDLWRERGVEFIFILFFRALPYTYAAEKPANVLRMTRLLEDQPARRVFETAQFVFDVMDVNWWEPDQRGVLTAVKIRMMHAAMRYMLLNQEAGEKWDAQQWGMPISQEDLIATNQVFSLEFFKGLELMGDPMPAEDQEAWYHTWSVLGSIMGVQDELRMPDVAKAWELQSAIYNHLFSDVSYAGIGLAKALVEVLSRFMISTKMILMLMRKMMKDDQFPDSFAKMLGPTYAEEYPNLFIKTRSMSEEEKASLNEHIHEEFMEELRAFNEETKKYWAGEQQKMPAARGERPKKLVDYQLEEFDEILNEQNQNTRGLVGDAMEAIARKAMTAIAGVIIDILSKYFREGKKAAFRMPADLKEHWAIS